jgi:hypothetical protein
VRSTDDGTPPPTDRSSSEDETGSSPI